MQREMLEETGLHVHVQQLLLDEPARLVECTGMFTKMFQGYMSHIQGVERDSVVLFPESLNEYVTEDNPVRFIDEYR